MRNLAILNNVAAVTGITTTEVLLGKLAVPSNTPLGTTYRFAVYGKSTATSSGGIVTLRAGTAGTTADASVVALTGPSMISGSAFSFNGHIYVVSATVIQADIFTLPLSATATLQTTQGSAAWVQASANFIDITGKAAGTSIQIDKFILEQIC